MLFLPPMQAFYVRYFTVFIVLVLFSACANIVPPVGGAKDTTPPVLLSILPADSQLNTRVTRIDMRFDEFIIASDAAKEMKISPLLPYPPNVLVNGKKLTIKIPDSLLQENTTYRISFGSTIKDLNENNVFKDFSYMFSTGSYFDSLKLYGIVYDAATGKPAGDVFVVLYAADGTNDSVVVKNKPTYVTRTNTTGAFLLPGLPYKEYRIYALKDDDDNLVYGGENEMIGFIDSTVFPVDSVDVTKPITFRIFKEIAPIDTVDISDSTLKIPARRNLKRKNEKEDFSYSVNVDTADVEKRVHDVNKPLKVAFSSPLDTFNTDRVFISYDSSGMEVETEFSMLRDTVPEALLINTAWKENTVYTIRLLKDFAADTAGKLAMPSKYVFRTKGEDDYGVLNIHVAKKYYGEQFLLQVTNDKDTLYMKPLFDTSITIKRLLPGKYNMIIIEDKNRNGKWDTGDLFAKKQPEQVIPYNDAIELKAGWENVLDFKEPVTEDPKAKAKGRPGATVQPPPIKGDTSGKK